MVAILISFCSLLLGLVAIRWMFALEKSFKSPLLRLTPVYFLAQHITFSFTGLVMALLDQGYYYQNGQGIFGYIDGMIRFQLVNLISIYAGLIGVRIAIIGRQPASRQRGKPPVNPSQYVATVLAGQNRALRKICYITMVFHIIIVSLQWYGEYHDLPVIIRYPMQVFAPVVVATFCFWGLWWRQAGNERLVFIIYSLIFGLIQMVSGGRGTFVAGVFLFFVVYLLAGNWRLPLRSVVALVVCTALFFWLITISENVRFLNKSRRPLNSAEWVTRAIQLLEGIGVMEEGGQSLRTVFFRSAVTINQLSTLDLVSRTPEIIPYAGWKEDEWELLLIGWLPELSVSEDISASNIGQFALLEYGWDVSPGFGHAMPMTLLADSWRRFGLFGVVVVHLFFAMLLTRVSILLERYGTSVFFLIFGGSVLAIVYHLFIWDIVGLVTALPRRLLACFACATIVYTVYFINFQLHRKIGVR